MLREEIDKSYHADWMALQNWIIIQTVRMLGEKDVHSVRFPMLENIFGKDTEGWQIGKWAWERKAVDRWRANDGPATSMVYTLNAVADETEQCYVTKTFRERQWCASKTQCWITFLPHWNENIPLRWKDERMLSAISMWLLVCDNFSMRSAFIELLRLVCCHFFCNFFCFIPYRNVWWFAYPSRHPS